MNKKYKLIEDEFIEVTSGYSVIKLYRIMALRDFEDVSAGDKGGFVEAEHNLSHEGNCWIYDNAWVYGQAEVKNDAIVKDNALVKDLAIIKDKAQVCNFAEITDRSKISQTSVIMDHSILSGKTLICGNSYIRGISILHNAKINDCSFSGEIVIENEENYIDAWIKNCKLNGLFEITNYTRMSNVILYGSGYIDNGCINSQKDILYISLNQGSYLEGTETILAYKTDECQYAIPSLEQIGEDTYNYILNMFDLTGENSNDKIINRWQPVYPLVSRQ